jgi:hypothetical protein
MTDIVERLRDSAGDRSTYEVGDDSVRITCTILMDAAREIERLRAMIEHAKQLGFHELASISQSFADIKKDIRNG